MKLKYLLQREGVKPRAILIPSNSGLESMQPNPFRALGLQQKEVDAYLDDRLGVEVLRYRGEDIPAQCDYFTSKGDPVFGFTGDDLFDEYRIRNLSTRLRLVDTIDWIIRPKQREDGSFDPQMYSRPTLCLISAEGRVMGDFPPTPAVVINGKYEATARQYLQELGGEYGIKFSEIRVLGGKTEGEIPERADYGIEIVLSGTTLGYLDKQRTLPRTPRLAVLEEIRQSDMSVITSWPKAEERSVSYRAETPEAVLLQQYTTLMGRLRNPTGSYSSELLNDENKLVKKMGEEVAELLQAFVRKDQKNFLEEMQQLFWLAEAMGVKLEVPPALFFAALSYQK